jgi:RTX calcium-binding nonapeptide repeat (4 copies)
MRFTTAPLLSARLRGAIVAAVAVLALAAMSSQASAAITIGSDLTVSDGTAVCGSCTGVQKAIPARTTASPITGVVVRWRVGDGVGLLTFRVARPAGDAYPGVDTHIGVARSEPVMITTPPSDEVGEPPVVSTFPTRVPIRAGDRIGVDLTSASEIGFRDRVGAEAAIFIPPLGDGERRDEQDSFPNTEGLLNADVEPDADRDGFGDETQDQCPTDPTTQGLCGGRCANERLGTENDDTLNGTVAGDRLSALGGNDVVNALGGDDCLLGGFGADQLVADVGNDDLDGGSGSDRMSGGVGADALRGGSSGDSASGGGGRDRMAGGSGDDRMNGGSAGDAMSGNAGRDRLSGASGRDRLLGGAGPDRLSGGGGNDRMFGASRADRLSGGTGNDRIFGGGGADRIRVGRGANRVSAGGGRDRIGADNGRRDRISCGGGRDRVVADDDDRVRRNCERVIRR